MRTHENPIGSIAPDAGFESENQEFPVLRSAADFDRLLEEHPELGRHFEADKKPHEEWSDVETQYLDRLPMHTLFRGIPPEEIFRIMNGERYVIEPYHETENASFEAANVLGYGASRLPEDQMHWATSFVGFDSRGFAITETGRRMTGVSEAALQGREHNVTVSGELSPNKVKLIVFRFPNPLRHRDPTASEFEYRVLVPKHATSQSSAGRKKSVA